MFVISGGDGGFSYDFFQSRVVRLVGVVTSSGVGKRYSFDNISPHADLNQVFAHPAWTGDRFEP